MIRNAIISVYDKTDIVEFARKIAAAGTNIISTGNTYRLLKENNINVEYISDYTGFPEIMDGRVKTLNPRIFGGILARRDIDTDVMDREGIKPIDLVVVNLYPFEKKLQERASHDDIIENIDIGGPSLIRAAAKNYKWVGVVVSPDDYEDVYNRIQGNTFDVEYRLRLAKKAFYHTARYDSIISNYFASCQSDKNDTIAFTFRRVSDLRYGENPHQKGNVYKIDIPWKYYSSPIDAGVLGGKALSFNNYNDSQAAINIAYSFEKPAVAIIKHTNPCGVAMSDDIYLAYRYALESDPMSAYGSIIAINRNVDEKLAQMINDTHFVEVIIAPGYGEEALNIIRQKKNRRILQVSKRDVNIKTPVFKYVEGGILVQDRDNILNEAFDIVVGDSESINRDLLLFAYNVVKYVKSNAIVLAKEIDGCFATVGIGAGQMSRLDAIKIAISKSNGRAKGSVMASDAFLPMGDNVDAAYSGGIRAIIQPGGSKRDEEVINRCKERNISLVFAKTRHFLH